MNVTFSITLPLNAWPLPVISEVATVFKARTKFTPSHVVLTWDREIENCDDEDESETKACEWFCAACDADLEEHAERLQELVIIKAEPDDDVLTQIRHRHQADELRRMTRRCKLGGVARLRGEKE